MPSMGKNCIDDLGEDIYIFPFGSDIIYYLSSIDIKIVVIAILHQNMAPAKHLGGRL